jgi:flagellar hook-associated protein 2
MEKIDSFVSKYNAAVTELGKLTKSSTDSDVRGIFSSESTVKGLKSTIDDLLSNVGGGVGSLIDYGFDIAKDGQMSIDKDVLNQKLDDSSSNVEAFFSGGTYTDANGTVELTGAFTEMSSIVGGYTDYNATLDQFKTSISDNITSLEERKTAATERLDNRYDILKKQFISYDLMISRLNSASSMFTQLANAQTNSNN